MSISTILDHFDSGHMALSEFQRSYVWSRDQVRGLMRLLLRGGSPITGGDATPQSCGTLMEPIRTPVRTAVDICQPPVAS